MHNAFPAMAAISLLYIPLLDTNLHRLLSFHWLGATSLTLILGSALAALCATWSATLIFGLLSALAHVLLGQVKTCSVLIVGALFYDSQVCGSHLRVSPVASCMTLPHDSPVVYPPPPPLASRLISYPGAFSVTFSQHRMDSPALLSPSLPSLPTRS